jgi:hypothetical protein
MKNCNLSYDLMYDSIDKSIKTKISNLIQNPFFSSMENLIGDSIYDFLAYSSKDFFDRSFPILMCNSCSNSISKLNEKF